MQELFSNLMDEATKHGINSLSWEINLGSNCSIMPSGTNGPYFHLETPIRNTSHWLTFYSIMYSLTNEVKFKNIAIRLLNFILSDSRYKKKFGFVHRQFGRFDRCNGVIGTAWVIESLTHAHKYLNRSDALSAAYDLASKIPFIDSLACWRRVDPERGPISIDYTFNHQAWLAAALHELNDPKINQFVERFLTKSSSGNFHVRPSGQIFHLVQSSSPKNIYNRFRFTYSRIKNQNAVDSKEKGYHIYSLHPLARLYRDYSTNPLFLGTNFHKSLDYCSFQFLSSLETNPYSFCYNAPGFEMPLIFLNFKEFLKMRSDQIWTIFEIQKRITQDKDTRFFIRNCPDPFTLNARIYELGLALEQFYILSR